ncbi:MAG TPA: aminotransferase class I/II-fold pyridoxal phosphate-dependent enzyme [Fibrobacteria bacterium]|nr:aminotransferase class I/II-fold pyridoxal phosphate-dependent enzyme [Fibrobacteria bacterium]HOX51083.1 aminotransferase class I/II-fold pyridoxal phosphate-dependent enzyme [Fibrobacteria bacterium]
MKSRSIKPSSRLNGVKYEIRGPLAQRALELEKAGYEIIKLNIGNPGAFGYRAPETMRLAMIENLREADAYSHQKGIFPAREAVVMQQQTRGVMDVTADDVFMGNGVSELILLSLNALLEQGDEVLLPSPDYPLWTAATVLHGGKPVHYHCRQENGWVPDPEEIRSLITPRTKVIVVISPNNPTGAVYPRPVMEAIAKLAEEHQLIVFSDEIYDQILYDGAEHVPLATLVKKTLCGTFGGLSKVYRACGFRVGWLTFSGEKSGARDYLAGLELLASLRLCSNVPGQWAVQTALGGKQSINDLTRPGGRLYQTRQTLLECVQESAYLTVEKPMGSIYAFVGVKPEAIPDFDDQKFALELLERKHVLVAPGTSFNVEYRNRFRVTLLPDWETTREVFGRIEELLKDMASRT